MKLEACNSPLLGKVPFPQDRGRARHMLSSVIPARRGKGLTKGPGCAFPILSAKLTQIHSCLGKSKWKMGESRCITVKALPSLGRKWQALSRNFPPFIITVSLIFLFGTYSLKLPRGWCAVCPMALSKQILSRLKTESKFISARVHWFFLFQAERTAGKRVLLHRDHGGVVSYSGLLKRRAQRQGEGQSWGKESALYSVEQERSFQKRAGRAGDTRERRGLLGPWPIGGQTPCPEGQLLLSSSQLLPYGIWEQRCRILLFFMRS